MRAGQTFPLEGKTHTILTIPFLSQWSKCMSMINTPGQIKVVHLSHTSDIGASQ